MPLAEGVALGVGLATGGVMLMLAVSDGVGTTPEDGTSDDTTTPEEESNPEDGRTPEDGRVGGKLLTGTGADAVGRKDSTLDKRLDSTVGRADGGTSETAEDRMLGRSETKDETAGGRIPIAVAEGVGAVGPRSELDGETPGNSDTIDESIEGNPSDVGMASEIAVGVGITSPVPSAVVIPTMIPEVGSDAKGACSEESTASLVGRTTLLGAAPVEPISGGGVGVGSKVPSRDDNRPPNRPEDEVGCKTLSGRPPVVPGTMKGPRKLEASGVDGASEETGTGVGVTIDSGIPPVDATRSPD